MVNGMNVLPGSIVFDKRGKSIGAIWESIGHFKSRSFINNEVIHYSKTFEEAVNWIIENESK